MSLSTHPPPFPRLPPSLPPPKHQAVFQAITDLHCERLGHGYHLFSVDKVTKKDKPAEFVEGLVQYVAKRRIMLEVCLTSNWQTM